LLQCFDFNYQIEVYVPQAKRKYGYYSLPILWRDRFVGRVDVKADRKQKVLLLQYLSIEEKELASLSSQEADIFLAALVASLSDYQEFNYCEHCRLVACSSHDFQQRLSTLLNRR
jgi:uncharacterized protein YcaQ